MQYEEAIFKASKFKILLLLSDMMEFEMTFATYNILAVASLDERGEIQDQ